MSTWRHSSKSKTPAPLCSRLHRPTIVKEHSGYGNCLRQSDAWWIVVTLSMPHSMSCDIYTWIAGRNWKGPKQLSRLLETVQRALPGPLSESGRWYTIRYWQCGEDFWRVLPRRPALVRHWGKLLG